jgi:acetylglutamate synthase
MVEMPQGTLLFETHESFDSIDQDAFAELIIDGFGKMLVADYFTSAKPVHIYLAVDKKTEKYVGAAVVESVEGMDTIQYLDKLVVAADKQQNGVGSALISLVKGDHAQYLWRAAPENPCNGFYAKQNPLRSHAGGWFIYNSGNIGLFDMLKAREWVASKPKTLEDIQR